MNRHTKAIALAEAQLEACRITHDFLGANVRPLVGRKKNALPWTKFADGLVTRAHAWLRSLTKLDHPGDFQAVAAATRATFELALDLLLVIHEEEGSFAKLRDWEKCKQFRLAEALEVTNTEAAKFVKKNRTSVDQLRFKHWPNKKNTKGTVRSRWTGRELHEDAPVADSFGAPEAAHLGLSGFAEYHRERYSVNCWYVHGSGMIGLHDCEYDYLPTVVALARRDAVRFSLVVAKSAVTLFAPDDAIMDARFRELHSQLKEVAG